MKWPWKRAESPEPALNESDSARLRRLEATINDLDADVEILLKTIPKINAKLRARSIKEAEETDGAEPLPESERPKTTKDQLRAFAVARGLR